MKLGEATGRNTVRMENKKLILKVNLSIGLNQVDKDLKVYKESIL